MTELVGSLVLCLLVGMVVDRGLLGDGGRGLIERFGRGLMLGLGTVGCVSMFVDLLGFGVSRLSVGSGLAVLVAVLARPAWQAAAGADPRPAESEGGRRNALVGWRPHVVHLVLLALAVLGLGIAVRSGWIRPTFQFDAVTRWIFKAKALHVDETIFGPISTDEAYGFTHQRYPPLVSHIANLPALLSGRFDDRIASAMFPWFAVALTAIVYGALRRRAGPLNGALGAAWVANLPLISYIVAPPPGAGAASAMADIPLALFITASVIALADAVDGNRVRAHLEAGIVLGFAALTKNEGLPFVVAVGVGLLVSLPRARLRTTLGITGVAGALYVGLWGWVSSGLPITDEHYLGRLNAQAVQDGLARLGLITPRLGEELVNFRNWNLTWLAAAALIGMGGKSLLKPVPRLILIALGIQLASYVFAYVITSWTSPAAKMMRPGEDPLHLLLTLTLGRLLLQVAPAAIVLGLYVSPLEPEPEVAPRPGTAPPPPAS